MSPPEGGAAPRPAVPAPGDPWTIMGLVLWSAAYLVSKGIETGRLEAEHLLAEALGVKRLQLYLEFDRPLVSQELAAFKPLLKRRAQRWKRAMGDRATVTEGMSTIGGGSLPGETLPTWLLALSPAGGAEALAKRLRDSDPPIIGRIEDEKVLLDPRTVLPAEEKELLRGVREVAGK